MTLEGLVKPAVHEHILATLEQTEDLNRLDQVSDLATATRSGLVTPRLLLGSAAFQKWKERSGKR